MIDFGAGGVGRRLMRTIFHVDMDAFFVSVEELFDPSLKGKAVVVGGQAHERGVVSAASYEARKFGVHSAHAAAHRAQALPAGRFRGWTPRAVPRVLAARCTRCCKQFSPLVEMASIDEAYLDMTGTERLHGPPLRAAHAAARRREERRRSSIARSESRTSRLVAKDRLRSGQAATASCGCCRARRRAFWRRSTCARFRASARSPSSSLHECGIRKVGDLARLDEAVPRRAVRQVGAGARGQGARRRTPAAGSMPRSARTERSQIDQPRAHLRRRYRRRATCSKPRWRGSPKWSAAACASTALHARTMQLKLRYSDFSTYHPRPHPRSRHRSSIPSCCRRSTTCSEPTGRPARWSGCWESTR